MARHISNAIYRSAADMDTDVLIVGGGPTGLMLANQLGRRGIRATIVDRHSGPAQQTRAMAVHARTLEIYSKLGIAERALELGRRGNGANMWAEGKWAARIPLGDIGKSISPFPFVLMLGQDDNERIMGDHLRNWGMAVQWNTELTGINQEPGHVTATLKEPDGSTRKIQTAYVAGCDGGHGAVRELSSITFPGAPYEHVFFVADTEATGPMVEDELNVYLWRDGFHLFFPMRGKDRWRVIGILPKKLRGRDDVTFAELSPDIRQEAGADLNFKECSWFSTYRIHHRAAEKFRDRRCFLLGDAAHVHSPMGGQGMNTGLQDAYNLAWKLALVVEGHADAALLDRSGFHAGGLRQLARGAFPHAHPREDRGLCDDFRAAEADRVPDHLPDRHSLPGKPAVENVAGRARRRAARGRSFSVVAAQVPGERPGRGPVPETRRHALQLDRGRTARAFKRGDWSRRSVTYPRDSGRSCQRQGTRSRANCGACLLPIATRRSRRARRDALRRGGRERLSH